MKPIIKSILLGAALTTLLPLAQAQFIITEIAALGTGLADEDGETSDWIEIRNLGISEADLAGWTLTDSAGQLDTWTFPPTSVPALGYIVVFASGKDRAITGSELHANFSLASGGEYLALTAPGNATPASEFNPAYPPQKPGFTYGNLPGATTAFAYFETASPGTGNNGTSFEGFVADTKFTVGRGYYSEAFDESITCSTPGATIVYTTDGSLPTLLNGTQVAAPDPSSTAVATVPITRTGPVRAAAFKENLRPTNTDTNTYIFPADVASQSASVTRSVYGLPPRWGNTTPDYGMDSDVVGPRDRFGGVYA
ncbi:MAG: lamin tail domain-containing protein, partial [Verrucomicrobiales bacterium]|nr:lamin tail domain-containing protein [Verrucomicrobiales bacterium]